MGNTKEDTHFYLDYASPDEFMKGLSALLLEYDPTTKEIADAIRGNYSFAM